jgi:hypothetical protein
MYGLNAEVTKRVGGNAVVVAPQLAKGLPMHELVSTAHHEAGHAVISRVLTLASGPASIKPDYEEGGAGFAETFDPLLCVEEWRRRGKVRDYPDAVWHARIMSLMAGAEAEVVLLGGAPWAATV